jgi:putative DNA primase/helicase
MQQSLLSMAQDYINQGYSIFPILPRDKRPATKSGFKDASQDPGQIKEWFGGKSEFGIGIATGAASGVVVVDIDIDKLTDESRKIVTQLQNELTACVVTGTGGLHFYFKCPPTTLRNRAGITPGIDFRADGGYVVAPPSIHPNGQPYTWSRPAAVKEMPQWVIDFVAGPKTTRTTVAVGVEGKGRLSRRTQHFMLNGVPDGEWNESLFFAAKDHQEQGYSIDEFTARAENITGHLDAADLKTIKSAYTQAPKYDPRNVEEVLESPASKFLEQSTYPLRYWQADFYEWRANRYKSVSKPDMRAAVVRWLKGGTIKQVEEILLHLGAMVHVPSDLTPPRWITEDRGEMIALRNGFIPLFEDGGLIEPSEDYFSLTSLPYNYDAAATCPTWFKVLEDALPDPAVRASLQEWFGYNLTRTSEADKLAILEGIGANGKSVVTLVLQLMLGYDNVSNVNIGAFNAERTFPMAATVGKLANIVSDMQGTNMLQEGILRTFASGERMTIEQKHKDAFSVHATAKLTFATNDKPQFKDRTNGTWRRLLYFKFANVVPPERRNPKFRAARFWLDSGELPGIFNWALEGLRRLRANSFLFTEAPSQVAEVVEYRLEQNPEIEFFQEYCTLTTLAPIGAEGTPQPVCTPRVEVFKAYKAWAEENEISHTLGRNNFFKALERQFPNLESRKIRPSGAEGSNILSYVGLVVRGADSIRPSGKLLKLEQEID